MIQEKKKKDNILSIICQAALGLQEKHVEAGGVSAVIQGLPAQLLGPVPLSVAMETKVSSSHQALLQHLLQKEQLRHQKILSTGENIRAFDIQGSYRILQNSLF